MSGKTGEVKWENAKSFGGRVHRAYIDYLFLLVDRNLAHFHIRFLPMSEYDHSLSGRRRRIDTVSKCYYQLIVHRALRHYSEHGHVSVYPDDGECTSHLPAMLEALRNEDKSRYCQGRDSCLQEILPRSSAREPMLQLLDVTLGALAAYRNKRHLKPEISQTKRDLAVYAFEKTGWPSIEGNCDPRIKKLNRWNVRPSLRRGRGG